MDDNLLRAWKHFHNGVQYSHSQGADHELAAVLIVSALEVASGVSNEKSKFCEHCKQPIYSIKKRVRAFAKLYGGDNFENMENMVGKFYDNRSKFLHVGGAGILFPRSPIWNAYFVPTLIGGDNHGPHGVNTIGLNNVIELSSYLLRIQARDIYAK